MGYLGWVLTIDGGAGGAGITDPRPARTAVCSAHPSGGEVSGMTSPRRCGGEGLDAGRVGLAEPSRQPFVKHGT